MARSAKNDRRDRDRGRSREESELIEKLVGINRVAKVVNGGRRFGFAALVIVGDGKGRVGHGAGKAREVPEAIRKATEQAKRGMVRVPLREGRTLHHDVNGHFGAGRVVLRAAKPGTGIIAGGPIRAIFEALGVQDVVAKSIGTSNPHNMIKAAFSALVTSNSPRSVAARQARRRPARPPGRGRRRSEGDRVMAGKTLKVTQIASPIGRRQDQRATLKGLGLNRVRRSRELEDTPAVRGMIAKVRHLVRIDAAN